MANNAEKLKGISISLDLDLTKLEKSVSKVKGIAKTLQTEFNKVSKQLKLDPFNFELSGIKTQNLNETKQTLEKLLTGYNNELAKLEKKGIGQEDTRWRALKIAISETEQKLKEVNKELALMSVYKITAPLDEFSTAMGKAQEETKKLAQELKWLSTAATAVLTAATKSAIDYEDAFASVKKTVEETANISYANLSDSIRELSKEVPSTASEIAEVVALAGQLGIETENVITFSKSMIDLGNSTNLSASEAAESLAKFINVTGSSASDIDKLGSALVWLGNNSATTEKDILELSYRLVGTGTSLGFTETQILGLSTALSSAGLKAEAAGGSISTVLQNIAKEVAGTDMKAANKELKVWGDLLGMSGKQFKKAWEDNAFDTFKQVIVALGNTENGSGALITKLSELGVETIRTTDSMQRLVRVGDLLDYYVDKANKAYKEGNALQIEAAKRYETTASQLKIFKNNVVDIGIELGNALLPKITEMIQKANKWVKSAKTWIGQNQKLVTSVLAFTAALAPALLGVSKFFGLLKTGASEISKFIKFNAQLFSGTTSLGKAILTGTVPSLGILIGVLGVAATAYRVLNDETSQQILNIKNSKDALENMNQVSSERYALIAENVATQQSELDYYLKLVDELSEITDENGNVLEGYEERAEFIKNELYNSGLVEQGSLDAVKGKYEEVTQAVYDTIEAKKASAIYDATFEMETQALQDQSEAMQWLRDNTNEVAEAKRVYAEYNERAMNATNELSDAELTAYGNAKTLLGIYDEMQAKFDESNAILDNVNAMREAYESGQYEQVINDFYLAEKGLITKNQDEVGELILEKNKEIEELKLLDDGTPFFKATIDATVAEADAMAKSIGMDFSQAVEYYNNLKALEVQSSKIANNLSNTVNNRSATLNRAYSGAFNSGGYGFASGGFTSNVTINVSNNGRDITNADVRRWANVINEQLGGSF